MVNIIKYNFRLFPFLTYVKFQKFPPFQQLTQIFKLYSNFCLYNFNRIVYFSNQYKNIKPLYNNVYSLKF